MRALTEQVSVIRSRQGPLGVAGCHARVIAAARALVSHRREAAAAASSSSSKAAAAAAAASPAGAATAVPAASSLLRSRRLAEFLYEAELRRCGRPEKAGSSIRRLLASLLFWMPRAMSPAEEDGSAPAGGGAASSTPARPPGFGKLPRPVAGHEKTALSQFQVWRGRWYPSARVLLSRARM